MNGIAFMNIKNQSSAIQGYDEERGMNAARMYTGPGLCGLYTLHQIHKYNKPRKHHESSTLGDGIVLSFKWEPVMEARVWELAVSRSGRQADRSMPSSRRVRIRPGAPSPVQAEDAAAEGVRKACRELGGHLEAFEKFRAEAETLATAMELVAEKIGLLASPGTGAVARALDEHPGAQERLVFRLGRRLESFREDGRALRSRFERQTLPALKNNCAALRLWVHRREAGAAPQAYRNAAEGETSGAGSVRGAVAAADHILDRLTQVTKE
ncbi:unnamed protein product, partial [Symbiodinium microadriaticum]